MTVFLTIWAVLSILLESQDVNALYVQAIQQYYDHCYDMKTNDYMMNLEMASGQIQQSMYDLKFDRVSDDPDNSVLPPIQQDEYWEEELDDGGVQNAISDSVSDIMTKYPQWSTETHDIENLDEINYKQNRRDIEKEL